MVPMIVVGNKCDDLEQPMQVATALAQRVSDDLSMPLFETSAKDDSKADHVDAIFLTLAHKVKSNKTLFKSGKLDRSAKKMTLVFVLK